jgi:hypothetical protein
VKSYILTVKIDARALVPFVGENLRPFIALAVD